MQEQLTRLKEIFAEVSDLKRAASLLNWDQQVNMPPGGAQARGDQLATLSRLAHDRFTAAETGSLLEKLNARAGELDPESDDAHMLKMTTRHYAKQTRVPSTWVAEFARVSALSQQAWSEAKVENNFLKFRPHLEKVVRLIRQYADFFAPYEHIYDPLLDSFEPEVKTREVQAIFEVVRPRQVALIQAIRQKTQVENAFLHQPFDEQKQWDFAVEALTRVGYNWVNGRMDKSMHPFTTGIGHGDVRITTRILGEFFNASFFAAMHEGGHAMYDQGIPQSLYHTLLDEGASMAIHESQSRMWENLVGRSLPFWKFFYPQLQVYFFEQLADISLEDFYKGVNRVEASAIRVEADEATYNLHIILRLELEIGLVEGSIQVQDLPEIWNESMKATLGIIPENDAKGVLQDIHWSSGLFGYFPTYALGNIIAAQLWEHIQKDIPTLDDQMTKGDFSALLKWLRKKLHQHGAKYEPQELLERVTGSKIDPQPYIRYLEKKFGDIYHLSI